MAKSIREEEGVRIIFPWNSERSQLCDLSFRLLSPQYMSPKIVPRRDEIIRVMGRGVIFEAANHNEFVVENVLKPLRWKILIWKLSVYFLQEIKNCQQTKSKCYIITQIEREKKKKRKEGEIRGKKEKRKVNRMFKQQLFEECFCHNTRAANSLHTPIHILRYSMDNLKNEILIHQDIYFLLRSAGCV